MSYNYYNLSQYRIYNAFFQKKYTLMTVFVTLRRPFLSAVAHMKMIRIESYDRFKGGHRDEQGEVAYLRKIDTAIRPKGFRRPRLRRPSLDSMLEAGLVQDPRPISRLWRFESPS